MTLFDEATSPRAYDAIVVGSGISGGWAAKQLCEAGLRTLVLERGRHVEHGDYPTAALDPWDLDDEAPVVKIGEGHVSALRQRLNGAEKEAYEKQVRFLRDRNRTALHHFVRDDEHPYAEAPGTAFSWIRGYQTGGRSLTWGRQSYRWSPLDFEANARDGYGVDWPIRYPDLAPYYSLVERFIGVSGRKEGLDILPDGEFQPPMDFRAPEAHFREAVAERFAGRPVTIGRVAHLTDPAGKPEQGRQACQYRNRCKRGCPYGGYFSANAGTLPAADRTGKLTLRPHSVVAELIYDDATQRARAVRVIDAVTHEQHEFAAPLFFLNASAVGTTAILLNSTSARFPSGLGNDSDQLGRNLMDHHFRAGAKARVVGFEDLYEKGRRANGIYIPRFRNLGGDSDARDFVRGYGYQGGASRQNWMRGVAEMAYGADFKDEMLRPGPWRMGAGGFGEVLPNPENRMTLQRDVLDRWGLPTVRFEASIGENERAMRRDMQTGMAEMLEAAGFKDVETYDGGYSLGLGIHEMGTARMGRDPKTSVLDGHNRIHACPNVYVTDGACMTSSACVNPSLTYMALTVRAAQHAVERLRRGEL